MAHQVSDSLLENGEINMQGLLNCGKINLLLGCLEVSLEYSIHRAGQPPQSPGLVQ